MAFQTFAGGVINPINVVPITGNIVGYTLKGVCAGLGTIGLGAMAANILAEAGAGGWLTAAAGTTGLPSALMGLGVAEGTAGTIGTFIAGKTAVGAAGATIGAWPVIAGAIGVIAVGMLLNAGVNKMMGENGQAQGK